MHVCAYLSLAIQVCWTCLYKMPMPWYTFSNCPLEHTVLMMHVHMAVITGYYTHRYRCIYMYISMCMHTFCHSNMHSSTHLERTTTRPFPTLVVQYLQQWHPLESSSDHRECSRSVAHVVCDSAAFMCWGDGRSMYWAIMWQCMKHATHSSSMHVCACVYLKNNW